MKKTPYFVYFLLVIGTGLIWVSGYFKPIYFKIIGLILIMFSVFKLQYAIPSKPHIDESSNLDPKDES